MRARTWAIVGCAVLHLVAMILATIHLLVRPSPVLVAAFTLAIIVAAALLAVLWVPPGLDLRRQMGTRRFLAIAAVAALPIMMSVTAPAMGWARANHEHTQVLVTGVQTAQESRRAGTRQVYEPTVQTPYGQTATLSRSDDPIRVGDRMFARGAPCSPWRASPCCRST